MTAAVFTHIADYFKKMHTDVVWPTMSSQPPAAGAGGAAGQPPPVFGGDKLVEFQRTLMESYVKAVRLFSPAQRSRPSDGCQCDDKTGPNIDAGHHPIPLNAYSETLQPCTGNDDCINQDEICINGFCVKKPYSLDLATQAFNPNPAYYEALEKSVGAYYTMIQEVLTAGLSKDPRKVPDVRDFLMEMYAGAAEAAAKLPCGPNNPCTAGTVCVKGRCVPYPFRLVFRVPGTPLPAPWIV